MSDNAPRPWTEPWTKLRGGLHRHFLEGRLDEATGYLFLRLLLLIPAEGFPESGTVWTSSADVAHRLCPGWSLKKAQRTLKRLEEGRYVRRWRQTGSRGTYPIQVHRWEVPFGVTQGAVVDAWDSTSYDRPSFFGVARDVTPDGTPGVTPGGTRDGDTVLEEEIEEEEREHVAAASSSLNGAKARGLEVVRVFDSVLESSGSPLDRRNSKAEDRAAKAALRFLEAVPNVETDTLRQAVEIGLHDPFLRDRGFPFELWASQGSRYVRQALAGATSRPSSETELGALLDAVDESSDTPERGTK